MLNKIYLRNFKSARDLSLDLGALTLLSGLNGSGKSTVLQSIATIFQSDLAGNDGGLLLGGPLVSLGQGDDVYTEGALEDTISIELSEDDSDYKWVCKADLDASQLEFIDSPLSKPTFLNSNLFQYLQADRLTPNTLYPQADQQARNAGFLGGHGEFTVDYLSRNSSQTVPSKRFCSNADQFIEERLWSQITSTPTLIDQVAGWLQQISPGVHIQAEPISSTDDVILKYRYYGAKQGTTRSNRPANVGFGITYSLPIIVACLAAPRGSLLLIENPEAHLHPQGQIKMGELLALCAADGVQVIVETHSDHVLNGVRLAIKGNRLNSADSKLHYFTRDIVSGDSYVETPSILPDGQLTNWPSGFFDQWTKALDSLLA